MRLFVIITMVVFVDFMGFHEKWNDGFFFHLGSCSKQLTKIERYALLVRFVLVK